MKINKNFEGENADTTIDDTSSTFLLCEMFHFNCIQNMSATYSMAYSQPLYWIIVLKPGWLVMSRFPYNVKWYLIAAPFNLTSYTREITVRQTFGNALNIV